MFKQCLAVVVLTGVACVAPCALAQNSGASDSPVSAAAQGENAPGRRFDPQERSRMLAKKLNLSSDQQSKVQDILQSAQSDMEKVHSDSSLAQADRRARMIIHQSTNNQIRALLNSDQEKKWDTIQARREGRMKRSSGRQPPVPSAPDQK
ncbi:MAG TPA: hypothetical protein VK473_12555 [Terriglobales bacterium]|nr:hypothetical protein [Terriglobales bacterium]